MSKSRIEIIALDGKNFYSVGCIEVTSKGEVYSILKATPVYSKISRHVSGEVHSKSKDFEQFIRKGEPIETFHGLENLQVIAFGKDSLKEVFNEYKLKKTQGIFCIDMRNYINSAFNLALFILTDEGLIQFFKVYEKTSKKQMYVFYESHPKIGLIAFSAIPKALKKD